MRCDVARPVADVTRDRLRAGLTARSLAGVAEHRGVDVDVTVNAEDDLAEVERDAHECVLSAFPAGPGAASALAAGATEERLEDVAESAEPGARPTAAERVVVATHVVALALLGIAEHVIGVRDELELLGRIVARVHVGVQLACEPSVCLFDLIGCRFARHAEDFVVVSHFRLSCP